jgi:hypothetical protein
MYGFAFVEVSLIHMEQTVVLLQQLKCKEHILGDLIKNEQSDKEPTN